MSVKEIEHAITQIKSGQVSGPDGFTIEFYKKNFYRNRPPS